MERKPATTKAHEPEASPAEADDGMADVLFQLNSDRTDETIASFRDRPLRGLIEDCDRVLACIAGFDTVFLMSPGHASVQRGLLDEEWFAGFNATLERVLLAATERRIDVAHWQKLTTAAYSFWRGLSSIDDTKAALVELFQSGTRELFTLKRALMVECAKPATPTVSVSPDRLDLLQRAAAAIPAVLEGNRAGFERVAGAIESLGAPDDDKAPAANLPKTRRGFQRLAETTTRDQPIIAAIKEGKSYRQVAQECKVSKTTVARVAKAYGLTGHAPETVPLDGTLQENLSVRGKPGKRGSR